ncbi:ankyrin repeat domain-containing protein 13D-like [Anneissia japonica]|uniref:ankyrin repeat domain-containing protein 13D-like n=1 Tax=Anneissia japonica TaxID=1529436 RepID=UPI00142590A0|nr:ankyrin repeat domain-containing protein 13D-like [Anneissia japonica]
MSRKATNEDLYPYHWLVWHNEVQSLRRKLSELDDITLQEVLEAKDPRGRTPLHLAVSLGHLESTKLLLRHGGLVNDVNQDGWTALQEAVTSGDPEIVQSVLQHRDHQRATSRIGGIPQLLNKLKSAPDFYIEMKWEFTSWVPLMSRICPSDTYKVWKSGPNVRIDTTLIGFDNMNWIRGSRSFIFKNDEGSRFSFVEVDHDRRVLYTETLELQEHHQVCNMIPSEDSIAARLTSPVTNTYIDTDKIEFTRNKSGIWGWRHDKVENVNNFECKVFSAGNVQLVTKTRTEHLTEADKERNKAETASIPFASPLQSLLGTAEQQQEEIIGETPEVSQVINPSNPSDIKPEDYFNPDFDISGRDIGRPKEMTTKVQKFKATLWLSEEHPLSMQEQVLPIIDLMAISNAHFAKLRDFITLQLPSGFPVKIEIPLFHILNARITFGNLYGLKDPVEGVLALDDSKDTDEGSEVDEVPGANKKCIVDEAIFEAPAGYSKIRTDQVRYEDDEMLQFAIQQSLLEQENGGNNLNSWEQGDSVNRVVIGQSAEDEILQRAIQESLQESRPNGSNQNTTTQGQQMCNTNAASMDEQMLLALQISQQELDAQEKQRKEEEDELQRIIALSLTEK